MIDTLAAAVVDQINAASATWAPLTFTAVFNDAPKFTTAELSELTVVVVPNNVTIAPLRLKGAGQPILNRMRNVAHYAPTVCVFIAQKGPASVASGTDPLVAWSAARRLLAEKMGKFFDHRDNRIPAGYTAARLQATEFNPLYDLDELSNNRSFLSMIRLTYSEHVRG